MLMNIISNSISKQLFLGPLYGLSKRVAGGIYPPAPTPPYMRVRIRRFTQTTGP